MLKDKDPVPTRPTEAEATTPDSQQAVELRTVTAKYPNHVWHVDLTVDACNARGALRAANLVREFMPNMLRRLAIIATKQTAQSFSAHDRAVRGADLVSWVDQAIAEALAIRRTG